MTETEVEQITRSLVNEIKSNYQTHTHPKYGIELLYALWQAWCCGYTSITALEFGVASGNGFRSLKQYATNFGPKFGINIVVKGFDTGTGLPSPQDYRDHCELWQSGEFSSILNDSDIIYGNVKQTIPEFVASYDSPPIGFVSLDLDHYHSTKYALAVFEMPPQHYLPAVMIHVDDTNTQLTMNPWCGAELAINEFTQSQNFRKFEQKHRCWNIDNFYALHVLDHPIRNGQQTRCSIKCAPL
jgi:hypothetical protein